jgi:hypothetical protein
MTRKYEEICILIDVHNLNWYSDMKSVADQHL